MEREKISLTAMAVDSVFDKQTIPTTEELENSSVKYRNEIHSNLPLCTFKNDTHNEINRYFTRTAFFRSSRNFARQTFYGIWDGFDTRG